MVIGLFLINGIIAVMGHSKRNFHMEEEISYIQENARFAMDLLTYDIRMAGFFGCTSIGNLTNSLNGSTEGAGGSYSSNGLKGFEYSELSDADFPPLIRSTISSDDASDVSDVIVTNFGDPDTSLVVTGHNPNSARISLAGPNNSTPGEILVAATPTCSNASIFQMTGPTNSGTANMVHNTGAATPGNCHVALSLPGGGGYDCSNPPPSNTTGLQLPAGSMLMRFKSHAFFVATSPTSGLPALFRMSLQRSGGAAGTSQIEEMVSGIERMDFLYGVDNDVVADAVVDRYFQATAIPRDTALGTAGNNVAWDRVQTVRVTLILRSFRPVHASDEQVDLGDGYEFNDRFLRQKVSTTIKLRNRGLGVSS